MDELTLLDSVISYMDIDMKGCSEVSKSREWYEVNAKSDYDLWLILEGKIKLILDEKEYAVQENDLFLLYPQLLYKAYALTDTCRFLFIHFDVGLGHDHRAFQEFPLAGFIPAAAVHEETALFLREYQNYKNGIPLSSHYMKSCFAMLLIKLIRYRYQNLPADSSCDFKKQPAARLRPVLGFISANLNRPISVGELAEAAGMSDKYFITYFKNAIGVTPANFILQLKMKKALEYLYEYKFTVGEVAQMVGYEDPYSFSRAFKKVYHIAPSKII